MLANRSPFDFPLDFRGTRKINSKKPTALHSCSYAGCEKTFATPEARRTHFRKMHTDEDWICKKAECKDLRAFSTYDRLQSHKDDTHSKRPKLFAPTTCSYPSCRSNAIWETLTNYQSHLKTMHGVRAKEYQEFFPKGI